MPEACRGRPISLILSTRRRKAGLSTFRAITHGSRALSGKPSRNKLRLGSTSRRTVRWAGSGLFPMSTRGFPGLSRGKRRGANTSGGARAKYQAFPEYYEWASAIAGAAGQAPAVEWVCTGPIAYRGEEALKGDIDNLKEALSGIPHVEAFMPAVSPTQLANWNKNEYYAS